MWMRDEGESDSLHVLDRKAIRNLQNWADWKERWASAATAAELDGLLHVGMDVALGLNVERGEFGVKRELRCVGDVRELCQVGHPLAEAVCFYLEVADGHLRIRNFKGGDSECRSNAYQRAALSLYRARKAAKVLAGSYFQGLRDYSRFWCMLFFRQDVFKKTLWFCRRDALHGLYNVMPRSEKDNDSRPEHYEKIIQQAPAGFIPLAFKNSWVPYDPDNINNLMTAEKLCSVAPNFMEILYYTGNLRVLYQLHAEKITDGMVRKLEEIIQKEEEGYEKALLSGSEAASCLAFLKAREAAVKGLKK